MALDRVRVLKIEKPSTGGTQTDVYPTDINPNEDAVDARGVALQNDSSTDETVLISRDASDNMTFADGQVSGTKTLSDLIGGGGTDDDQVDTIVAEGETFTVKEDYQHILFEELTVDGEYIVDGESVFLGGDEGGGGGLTAHALGGAYHTAATLAELNALVSDATLDTSSASRTPTAHKTSHENNGADEISVAGLSGVLADNQPAIAHALGGSKHTSATLAELNALVSDATLDTSSASRTPTAHASSHASGGGDAVKLDDLATPDDNTDLNATTSQHGLLPKLGGGTTNFLRADGTWNPAGGSAGPAEMVYGTIRGKDWAPTWAQLDAIGDAVVLNVGIISTNFVGNATVATINGLSPAQNEAYVVTDSGTINGYAVTPGSIVVYLGIGWYELSTGEGGFVQAGKRLQLSTTIALISPYTDGTDDGKVMAFDGTSLTGAEAAEDVTLTLPSQADLTETDRYRGPITVQRIGVDSSPGNAIVKPGGSYTFADGLDEVHLVKQYDVVKTAVSKALGCTRLNKIENVLQVLRAATWAHTNFSTSAPIPWDTVDLAGSDRIAYRNGTTTSRIQIDHTGWYQISTFAQIDSSTTGGAYLVQCFLRVNGTTDIPCSTIEVVNWEDENMYLAHSSCMAYLSSATYIELMFYQSALVGNISRARMTLRSLY